MIVASVCTGTRQQLMRKEGEPANITCPFSKPEWRTDKFPGKIFTDDTYFAAKNYLVIRNFTVNDEGIYKCYNSTHVMEFNISVEGNFVLFRIIL